MKTFLPVDSIFMQTKSVKRYVTVGTVMTANLRVRALASSVLNQSAGIYLSSGERLNRPTRSELEAAGRRALASELRKKTT